MKKLLKITLSVIVALLLLIMAIIGYIKFFLPSIDPPELKVELTPDRIERGDYLANSLMGCMDCHAQRDWSKFTGPTFMNTRGGGGVKWSPEMGFPGELIAPNITNLKDWSDGEIYRAITCGVSKDGTPLFPIMPYLTYGQLEKEDIYSVIAYLRTLEPQENEVPERALDFPLNIIVHTMPTEGGHQLKLNPDNEVEYGKYLLTAAACYDCHTQQDQGQYLEEMAYAGGMEFPLETGGVVRSANITPDPETGLGKWTKEQFIEKFKSYADSGFVAYEVKENEYNTFMPWTYYANLQENELGAIFTYLQTLSPVKNKVEKFTAN
ncbi:MAG: c-type cytochrome [Flammeovirgaceae bacterium]|nr:c-type cytochrome [Flammeovirgaceae bacterium]